MKALDRSVETLGLWIVISSITLIKSINQSSIKPCLIVHLVAVWTLIYNSFFLFFLSCTEMRGLLWMKASRNKQEVGRSMLLWPHPLLPLPFLIWSMKGFSPPLRDVPRCNEMPSLKIDYESANWNLFWTRNTQAKRKCTNRMVNQLLNLLHQSEETYVSNNRQ